MVFASISSATSNEADSLPIECSNCGEILVTHQPDEDLPDRILGTCRRCKCWFLIDGASGGILQVLVPGKRTRRASMN